MYSLPNILHSQVTPSYGTPRDWGFKTPTRVGRGEHASLVVTTTMASSAANVSGICYESATAGEPGGAITTAGTTAVVAA